MSEFNVTLTDYSLPTPLSLEPEQREKIEFSPAVKVPICVPEIINQSLKNKPQSPILSPFARYTRKQNDSLLNIVKHCNSEQSPSASMAALSFKSPLMSKVTRAKDLDDSDEICLQDVDDEEDDELKGEVDEFGFLIELSREIHSLQNNLNFDTYNSDKEAVKEWKTILADESKRGEIPLSLIQRGIPHHMRKPVWKYLAALHEEEKDKTKTPSTATKIIESENPLSFAYKEYQQLLTGTVEQHIKTQIEMDILRTFTTHTLFTHPDSIGRIKLQRILTAYAVYNPDIGYCQGMSYVVGLLLMYFEEAETFWLLEWILQLHRLGANYTKSMSGILNDSTVFDELLHIHYPLVYSHFQNLGIHPLMFITTWFMTLFTSLNSWRTVLHFFDILFYYGPQEGIFRFGLSLIHVCQKDILNLKKLEQLLPYLQSIPVSRCQDPLLFPLSCSFPMDHFLKHAQEKLNSISSFKVVHSDKPKTPRTTSVRKPKTSVLSINREEPESSPESKSFSFFEKVFTNFSTTPSLSKLASATQTTGSKRGRFFSRFTGNDNESIAKKQKVDNGASPIQDKENQTPVKPKVWTQQAITSPTSTVHYGVMSNLNIF